MNKDVYVVREDFIANKDLESEKIITSLIGAFESVEEAKRAIDYSIEDVIDSITGGDENNISNVSFENKWDGKTASVGDDNCNVWTYSIEKLPLNRRFC